MKNISRICIVLAGIIALPAFADTTYDAAEEVTCNTEDLNSDTSATFQANWEPIQWNVVYNVNGASGTAPSNTTCDYNGVCSAAAVGNLTKANAAFGGWTATCSAPGGGACAGFSLGTVNGGTSIANATTTDGATITLTAVWDCAPCNPTNASCELSTSGGVCTYSTSCLTGYENIDTTVPYAPVCTAKTVSLTYVDEDGTTPVAPGSGTCTYDQNFNLPAAPTKSGYRFAGWTLVE
jgi:hypothetical protein